MPFRLSDLRQRLEEVWLARLKHAEAIWLRACRDYELACECSRGVDSAYLAREHALGEYKRVLRVFTDLVVHRNVPREETEPWDRQGPEE